MKKSQFVFVIIAMLLPALFADGCTKNISRQNFKLKDDIVLIYENNFSEPESIKDWILEGPGTIEWQQGKMLLIPDAQRELYDKWERCNRKPFSLKEYYATIRNCVLKSNPSLVDKLNHRKGGFVGGHIVCWNKKIETDENYIIEYDFKPLSPIGLGMVFFSAKGKNGEDILNNKLVSRDGVFERYTKGDINCYHISYWANNETQGIRKYCNLRKNSGFYFLAKAKDPTVKNLDYSKKVFDFKKYNIRIVKMGSRISFYVDGQLIIDFVDNQINDILNDEGTAMKNIDTGKALKGGRIGLRHMAGLKAEYSNFKIYKIIK